MGLSRLVEQVFGPSRITILERQVVRLADQLEHDRFLVRDLLREVLHTQQANAEVMQRFLEVINRISELQTPSGDPERRVSTDQTEYETWAAVNGITTES